MNQEKKITLREKYNEVVKDFRPVFGNNNHFIAVKMMERLEDPFISKGEDEQYKRNIIKLIDKK